eukprot:TRINITY_DN9692_c0_g1_i1.p3 TRINITY_DN9692_c0_g1~~TRINITY_DN9692_c0_g1_i1.p3  ORF type:complete len:100 (+),score=5.51 TRINITY_DN9692_c0_g1_i1:48-302(+)
MSVSAVAGAAPPPAADPPLAGGGRRCFGELCRPQIPTHSRSPPPRAPPPPGPRPSPRVTPPVHIPLHPAEGQVPQQKSQGASLH